MSNRGNKQLLRDAAMVAILSTASLTAVAGPIEPQYQPFPDCEPHWHSGCPSIGPSPTEPCGAMIPCVVDRQPIRGQRCSVDFGSVADPRIPKWTDLCVSGQILLPGSAFDSCSACSRPNVTHMDFR